MGWEKEVEGTEMGGKGMEGRDEEGEDDEEGEEGDPARPFWSKEETEGSFNPDFKSFEEPSLSVSNLALLRGGALLA